MIALLWFFLTDPAILALDVDEQMGLRQQRILEADEHGIDAARGEETYVRWNAGRSEAIAQASRPSIQVQTVTALASGIGAGELNLARVQIESVQRVGAERPGGRRFGALVHAVLATVDPDACACRKSDSAILVMKAAEDRL
jgi:ATP-dependent helicase/nuclease subunit A